MSSKTSGLYHLFIVLSVVNLLSYYLFIGRSVIDIHEKEASIFDDAFFNYFLSVSVLLLLIWFSYRLLRKKIYSKRLLLLHLLITGITVFVLPGLLLKLVSPMPGRYIE